MELLYKHGSNQKRGETYVMINDNRLIVFHAVIFCSNGRNILFLMMHGLKMVENGMLIN